ncbi:MAG: hypothetical protein ABFD85_11210 [Phycisphaerae bacterium]
MDRAWVACILAVSLCCGCQPQAGDSQIDPSPPGRKNPAPPTATQPVGMTAKIGDTVQPVIEVTPGTAPDPRTHVLILRLQVITIEAPVGTVSGSEEIWSYVDEEPLGPARAAALGRNGLRVGLGRRDTWPDLARILKGLTAKGYTDRLMHCLPGKSVEVPLKDHDGEVTIFTSQADRTLSGSDYPPGQDLLSLLGTINEDQPWNVLITALPQIRAAQGRQHLVTRDGRVVFETRQEMFDFPALRFQLSVRAKDFLIVGPNAQSGNSSSPGHHFLVRDKDGSKFETVLVIIPEVLATAKPAEPPAQFLPPT